MDINLVLEGGGVKGIALVGALKRLEEEHDVSVKGVAGTSAGSIVAALYAAGYSADEMKEILLRIPFSTFLDSSWSKTWSLWRNFGLYRTDALFKWVYELLKQKSVLTFSDTQRDLVIIASDLTTKEVLAFDKMKYPKDPDVATAVRMSSSIPFFFNAYEWGRHLVVDGGLLSNYPFWAFANSKLPTFGFKLVSDASKKIPGAPTSLPSYVSSLVSTMLDAHDKKDMQAMGADRTVHIGTGGVATTNFALSNSEKEGLFNSGYLAASQFIFEKKPFAPDNPPAPSRTASPKKSTDEKTLFGASVELLRNTEQDLMETAFDPVEIRRYLTVQPPAAIMANEDDLINISGRDQDHILRRIASDAPTDKKKLQLRGEIAFEGKTNRAAVTAEAGDSANFFRVRIGFNGPAVAHGKMVKVSWSATIPTAVGLDEDYWVFPVNQFAKPVPVFVIRATFARNPIDKGLYAGSGEDLRPVSLIGPTVTENGEGGRMLYTYEARVEKAEGMYLLRWRFE